VPLPAGAFPVIAARPNDFSATFFWAPNCSTGAPPGEFSEDVGSIGFCMAVHKSVDSGYVVRCNTDATGVRLESGTFSVCTDYPFCAKCGSVTAFGDNQCIAQPDVAASRSAFGASSASFRCINPVIPPALVPAGRALLSWFEDPLCNVNDHRT